MSPKISQREKERYAVDASSYRPATPYLRNFVAAFVVGGGICVVGQLLHTLFMSQGLNDGEAGARMAVTIIALGALLTGLGIYDELGRFAGAGSAIPISGFANSIAAPAMEFAREGYVLGVGAQMFVVAGPVIVYGLIASFVMAALRFVFLG